MPNAKEERGEVTVEPATIAPIDEPPDGGYAWVVCAAVSSINGFTWGIAAAYGVFLSHYLSGDYFPDGTALDYAFIGGIQYGSAFLISPLVTISVRELGRLWVMSLGSFIFAGGYVSASFATRIWHLYLSQGLMVGLGMGCIFVSSVQVLPQWFLKRRSLAQGIASAGSGLAGLAFSLGTNAIIEQISLAWALRITGIIGFVGNLGSAMLVRDRNHLIKPPQLGFAVHLLRRYDCALLLMWAFVNLLGFMTVLYSLSNYAVSIVGLSQTQAGVATALLNLGTAIGRPAIGFASDYFGRVQTAAILTLACGISVFAVWVPANSYGVLIFFSLLSGGTLGVFWNTIGPLCAEVVGLKELPSFLNLVWLVVVLPTTFAEVAALNLRRPSMGRWGYVYAQVFAGLAYIIGSLFLFELWRVRRKQGAAV